MIEKQVQIPAAEVIGRSYMLPSFVWNVSVPGVRHVIYAIENDDNRELV